MITVRITRGASSLVWRAIVNVRPRWWCFWRRADDYEAYAVPLWSVDGFAWYRYGREDRDVRVAPSVQRKLEEARRGIEAYRQRIA